MFEFKFVSIHFWGLFFARGIEEPQYRLRAALSWKGRASPDLSYRLFASSQIVCRSEVGINVSEGGSVTFGRDDPSCR